jgi:hypothetical protein
LFLFISLQSLATRADVAQKFMSRSSLCVVGLSP